MINSRMKVSIVVQAYLSVVTKVYGGFTQVKEPSGGGLTECKCVSFYDAAEKASVPVVALMKLAMECYSRSWYLKVFGRSYPPFTVAISEACLTAALRSYPENLKSAKADEVAQYYADQLRGLNPAVARSLVESGLCGSDRSTQERVLAKLQEAVNL